MSVKLIIITIILLLFVIIILQNTQPVSLNVLLWDITLPFIVMLFATLIIGLVSGMVLSSLAFSKKRKHLIKVETKKS
ncbi:MAG: LapA family protein [Spirochaetota bacterium]